MSSRARTVTIIGKNDQTRKVIVSLDDGGDDANEHRVHMDDLLDNWVLGNEQSVQRPSAALSDDEGNAVVEAEEKQANIQEPIVQQPDSRLQGDVASALEGGKLKKPVDEVSESNLVHLPPELKEKQQEEDEKQYERNMKETPGYARVIAERSKMKTHTSNDLKSQISALMKSRSIARTLDMLCPIAWYNLRTQHLAEYEDFLEGLSPAEFGPEHQFGLGGQRVSLPPVSTIAYAFRFTVAAYGSVFTVDAETERRQVPQLSGLPDESLLQIETGESGRPAYALFLDHSERRCVLAIRGTATIEDAWTDADQVPVFDESLNGYVHAGFGDAAQWVLGEVAEVMKAVGVENPEYTLMITGHSLGAAVAALVTLLLEHQEPQNCGFHDMHGIGFATPGTATLAIAESPSAMQCFTTIVCARDAGVRVSPANICVMQHEVAMAATRTRCLDKVGQVISGPVQNYAERRHKSGAEAAEQLSGPRCFPVGSCIVLADPGEANARALVAMPSSISKMFVHEQMASDHLVARYALGLQCLGWAPVPEGSSSFFGAMGHEDLASCVPEDVPVVPVAATKKKTTKKTKKCCCLATLRCKLGGF